MLYNIVLFLHITGAVIMCMAIAILALSMLSMLQSKDTENVKRWSGLAVKTDVLFPMSTLLIIVPALYLVFSTWGWGTAWINVSLAALLGASFLGPVINLRRLKGILAAAEADVVPSISLMNKVRDRVLWNSVFDYGHAGCRDSVLDGGETRLVRFTDYDGACCRHRLWFGAVCPEQNETGYYCGSSIILIKSRIH